MLNNFAKTPIEVIVSIVIQFRENAWAIGDIWSTVLAVYRVKLTTWSQRANNFEIYKILAKFGLNCGTSDTFCHNFGLKMNFIRL